MLPKGIVRTTLKMLIQFGEKVFKEVTDKDFLPGKAFIKSNFLLIVVEYYLKLQS